MKKPDVILFLTDDHGQWANSVYGNPDVHTPALDFLASQGAVMENAFTPTPVCSPSRACLFTGRIASQHGVHDYLGSGPDGEIDQHPWMKDEKLISSIFHDHGYHTGLVGKWHLGGEAYPQGDFDYSFSLGPGYPVLHGGTWTYYKDGKPVEYHGYKTDVITDKAIEFIREHQEEKDSPYFLIIGYVSTHHPWEGQPERLADMYREKEIDNSFQNDHYPFGIQNLESTFETRNDSREALCQYYAGVTHIDEAIGRVVNEIYSSGREKETLIVYTSDHGLNCGHHGIWGKGNGTLPLNMVEESIRIPLVLSLPGSMRKSQRREEFVDHIDLFQTILEAAGICLEKNVVEGRNYPGRSFYPMLADGNPVTDWRDIQCCEYGDVRMIRSQRYKLVMRYPKGPHGLFDLSEDLEEKRNLYDEEGFQQVTDDLKAQLNAFYEEYTDPEKSGLNVKQLPRHNQTESWRDARNPQ